MGEAELPIALAQITETAARTLEVSRVGVWLFNEDRTAIVCACLHADGATTHRPGVEVGRERHPRYFAALAERRTLPVDDAQRDARTGDLADDYLVPLGITSMLDAAVRIRGEIAGVVCHEHTGPRRAWTPEEEHFATSIGDLVALALEASRRREVEDELRHAQKMEAIGVLAGGVAHDFNNLLTAILGYCDLTLREQELPPRVRSHIGEIQRSGQRAAALTRQLLAFGRKQVLAPRLLDLNDVVASVDGLLRRIIGEDISLETRTAPDVRLVRADPNQVEQVLVNLVANARDAMPSGGDLTISTANRPGDPADPALQQGPWVELTVRDTGVGIDPEIREKIFDPFFTTKAIGKGTGLGLASVYGIIRQSGGHVRVESAPGEGTAFRIYLPAVLDAKPAAPVEASAALPDAGSGQETILIVEDEPQVLALAREVLEEKGYRVLHAADGAAAVETVAAHRGPLDLLITDMVMPGPGGPDTYRRIRAMRPGIRVLYISGYAEEAIADRAGAAHGGELLEKPFTPGQLLRRVRQILDEPPPEAAPAA
jgi:signal transduction histidine kinase